MEKFFYFYYWYN